MEATAIDHVNVDIPDDGVEDAVSFYEETLGFELENLEEVRAGEIDLLRVRLGETCILYLSPTSEFAQHDGGYNHAAICIDRSPESVRELLADGGVEIRTEAERSGAAGSGYSLYVEDPFGHVLELKAMG